MRLSAMRGLMKADKPRRVLSSLFSKLLLVLLAAGLCINLLVLGFFIHHIKQITRERIDRNLVNYCRYLTRDLGTPPDPEKAKKIAEKYLVQIYYEGREGSWRTTGMPLPTTSPRMWITIEGKDYQMQYHRGQRIVTIYPGEGRLRFLMGKDIADGDGYRHLMILLAILTGILLLTYLALRWILQPIRWLHQGVGRVAAGDLSYRVTGDRSDQLGDLVRAFNQMTDRIRNMLHDRNQLLLDVSHELRTPLARMKVALEFLPDDRVKASLREDMVEMAHMITTLLDEARLRHNQLPLQEMDLVKLLMEVVAEFNSRLPVIETGWGPDARVWITASSEHLRILFRNLLDNAVKYSDPDGSSVTIGLSSEEDGIVVTVSDHGQGIPQEDLPHIFKPFYRVDKSRTRDTGGYGIGLSLCKAIVEAHGGRIEARSDFRKGTTMYIHFPIGP